MDIYINKKVEMLHYYNDMMIVLLNDGRQIFVKDNTMQLFIEKIAYGNSLSELQTFFMSKDIINEKFEAFIYQQISHGRLKDILSFTQNEKHVIITGKKGKRLPLRIQVELTRECNLNCMHCYKIANKDRNKIGLEELKRLLNYLPDPLFEIGVTGGEPTVHKDFIEITEMIAEKALRLGLNTNGILLWKLPSDIVQKYKLINISLYGTSDKEYYQVSGSKNAFSELEKSTLFLRQNGIKFKLSVLLDKDNSDRIEEYVKAAINLGAAYIQFAAKAKIGRGKELEEWIHYLDHAKIREVYRTIRMVHDKYRNEIDVTIWSREWFNNRKRENFQNTCFSCEAGSLQWIMTENGKFKPCIILPEIETLEFSDKEFIQYINSQEDIDWAKYYRNIKCYCDSSSMKTTDFCNRILG